VPVVDNDEIRSRDVFIHWIGSEVGIIQKGQKKAHVGEVQAILQPHHADLIALNKGKLTTELVVARTNPQSGSHILD